MPQTNPTYRLFVYGTLRPPRDGVPDRLTQNYEVIMDYVIDHQPAILAEDAVMRNVGSLFPAVYAEEGGMTITGDVLTLTEKGLLICDGIKHHPVFYERREVAVFVEGEDQPEIVWMYFGPRDFRNKPVIESGDWLNQ